MKLPHWLRCDWSEWGAPRDIVAHHHDMLGGAWTTTRTIQRRVCRTCKKVEMRLVRRQSERG